MSAANGATSQWGEQTLENLVGDRLCSSSSLDGCENEDETWTACFGNCLQTVEDAKKAHAKDKKETYIPTLLVHLLLKPTRSVLHVCGGTKPRSSSGVGSTLFCVLNGSRGRGGLQLGAERLPASPNRMYFHDNHRSFLVSSSTRAVTVFQ